MDWVFATNLATVLTVAGFVIAFCTLAWAALKGAVVKLDVQMDGSSGTFHMTMRNKGISPAQDFDIRVSYYEPGSRVSNAGDGLWSTQWFSGTKSLWIDIGDDRVVPGSPTVQREDDSITIMRSLEELSDQYDRIKLTLSWRLPVFPWVRRTRNIWIKEKK